MLKDRQRYCHSCGVKYNEDKLYDVQGRKCCADCGKEAIRQWNDWTAAAQTELQQ